MVIPGRPPDFGELLVLDGSPFGSTRRSVPRAVEMCLDSYREVLASGVRLSKPTIAWNSRTMAWWAYRE